MIKLTLLEHGSVVKNLVLQSWDLALLFQHQIHKISINTANEEIAQGLEHKGLRCTNPWDSAWHAPSRQLGATPVDNSNNNRNDTVTAYSPQSLRSTQLQCGLMTCKHCCETMCEAVYRGKCTQLRPSVFCLLLYDLLQSESKASWIRNGKNRAPMNTHSYFWHSE